MSGTIDRYRAKKAAEDDLDSAMDGIFGDGVEDAKKYAGLVAMAAGAAGEMAADAERKKTPAYKAKVEADKAREQAALAAAQAITETDPNGPLHKKAQELELKARAAEQKAAFYANPGEGGAMQWAQQTAMSATSGVTSKPWFWPVVGVGVLGAGFLLVKALRK